MNTSKKILCLGNLNELRQSLSQHYLNEVSYALTYSDAKAIQMLNAEPFDMLVINAEERLKGLKQTLKRIARHTQGQGLKVFLVAAEADRKLKYLAKRFAAEIIAKADQATPLLARLSEVNARPALDLSKAKPGFAKRCFDIAVASSVLLVAMPILLIAALFIAIESKGPIYYTSKRVGAGYKVFNLYKLRSMRVDADQQIAQMDAHNMYKGEQTEMEAAKGGDTLLMADDGTKAESKYLATRKAQGIFKKFSQDPRVTRVGQFIRNTSIDELPQLINIIKGDMSLVGNRPLPLYEAERLTTDEYVERFMAPAGLTGLWQVSKRGKQDMSVQERISLDNQYAREHSFWYDLQLMIKTVPALLQTESV